MCHKLGLLQCLCVSVLQEEDKDLVTFLNVCVCVFRFNLT